MYVNQDSTRVPKDTPLPVPHALEFMGDALLEQNQLTEAASVFQKLVELDAMRAGYWEYRRRECLE